MYIHVHIVFIGWKNTCTCYISTLTGGLYVQIYLFGNYFQFLQLYSLILSDPLTLYSEMTVFAPYKICSMLTKGCSEVTVLDILAPI